MLLGKWYCFNDLLQQFLDAKPLHRYSKYHILQKLQTITHLIFVCENTDKFVQNMFLGMWYCFNDRFQIFLAAKLLH